MQAKSFIKKNILKFIEHKDITKYRFYQETGITRGVLDQDTGMSEENTSKFLTRFPEVDINWLLTGRGNMLTSDAEKISQPANKFTETTMPGAVVMQIPLVPVYAYAGYLCGFGDQESLVNLPTIPMVATHQGKGNYIAIEVKGDSMDDESPISLLPRDIIVCREINPIYWQQDTPIHYKKWNAFLIVHKEEGIIVKKIIAHNTNTKVITAHSLNLEYPDQDIALKDVHQLFNVIQVIRNLY